MHNLDRQEEGLFQGKAADPAKREKVIRVHSLKKFFGEHAALQEVSFEIAENSVTGLLGPNGAGKTTTFRILATLVAQSFGEVNILGFDLIRDRSQLRKHLGYLPDQPPLYGEFTVEEQLFFAAELFELPRTG